MELNPNRSAVGPQSLCSAIQTLGSRLTHLNLSHNRLAGIPQLITTLSVCLSSRAYVGLFVKSDFFYSFEYVDILSEFELIGPQQCEYSGRITWRTAY